MSHLRQDHSTDTNGAALLILDRKHALILFGIATVVFTVILELIDPSHVSHGPTILDFEFAGSRSGAAQIMAEWGAYADSRVMPRRVGGGSFARGLTAAGRPA